MIGDAREIEEYYIAYVDLLGYKNFFEKHADQVSDFLRTIQFAIEKAKGYVVKANLSSIMNTYADMDIKVKIFSDNIHCLVPVPADKISVFPEYRSIPPHLH